YVRILGGAGCGLSCCVIKPQPFTYNLYLNISYSLAERIIKTDKCFKVQPTVSKTSPGTTFYIYIIQYIS
ncbi:MAG: hypothetical protein QXF80_06145, partial [Thermoplasmatales archaeon]